MSKPTIKSTLSKLGLTEKEIIIYLAALELGDCNTKDLANKTKISRTSIYLYTEPLQKKGFLSEIKKGSQKYFKAEDPENLNNVIARQKNKLRNEISGLDDISQELPDLIKDLHHLQGDSSFSKSNVIVFDGIDGIIQSYYHILNNAKDHLDAYFSVVEIEQPKLQSFFAEKYAPERAKRKIFSRNITTKTPKTLWYQENQEKHFSEFKLVSKDKFPLINSEINLYEDYMHCISFDAKNGFAFIVKNPSMVSLHKALFEIAWNE